MADFVSELLDGKTYDLKIHNLSDDIHYARYKLVAIYFVFNNTYNINSVTININDKVVCRRDVKYFTLIQPYQHSIEIYPDVGLYSFSLNPLSDGDYGCANGLVSIEFDYKENDKVMIYYQYQPIYIKPCA